MSNYPRKIKHFPAFLEDCTPYLLLIYYWGMSLAAEQRQGKVGQPHTEGEVCPFAAWADSHGIGFPPLHTSPP